MYIAVIALLSFSSFFAAAEVSITAFNRLRMKKQAGDGSIRAKKVLDTADNYESAISTILIGVNIAAVGSTTIATIIATSLMGEIGAVISAVLMTFIALFFCDINPKTYAKQNADTLSLKIVPPLRLIMLLLSPLTFLFTKLNTLFVRETSDQGPSVTQDELKYIIDSIEEEGVIKERERELIQSALDFDAITSRDVATPRVNIVALDIESSRDEITKTILEEGFSRIPVYEASVDNIIGILYAKEYLCQIIQGEIPNLRNLIKDPYFIHTRMKISLLMQNFKARKINLAVVLDEYGGTIGIVTMEDLLEQLVGDLWDEDEEIPEGLIRLDSSYYEVSGEYDIIEMFADLGIEGVEDQPEHYTVSGWAIHQLGYIPENGESFEYSEMRFRILEMDGQRVNKLSVEKLLDNI